MLLISLFSSKKDFSDVIARKPNSSAEVEAISMNNLEINRGIAITF